MTAPLLVGPRGEEIVPTDRPGRAPSVPLFNESIGSALIDSARISVIAALSILPNSSPIVLSPIEDDGPSLHDCLEQAMQWLDAARVQTIERGAPVTSLHTVTTALRCTRCGCTEGHACEGGCSWASTDPPICSRCA